MLDTRSTYAHTRTHTNSRFDLFFVILDECNPVIDEAIARHIIAVHQHGGCDRVTNSVHFTAEQMQRYIRFARTLNPLLTKESRKVLVNCYRLLRQNDILGKNKTAYRITGALELHTHTHTHTCIYMHTYMHAHTY